MSTPEDVYGPFSKFDAIKDYKYNPNSSNSEDLTKDQQRDLDRLEGLHGKIVVTKKEEDKVSLVEEASSIIMGWYHFVTVEETKEILYYKDGVYLIGGDIIIEKETERYVVLR